MPKDTPMIGRARNRAERQRKRRFSKLSTGNGMEYYIPEDGGASVSNLPDDAEVCEINPMYDSAEIGAFNKQRRGRFSKFLASDGKEYYVPEGGGKSLWTLPAGAVVVHL